LALRAKLNLDGDIFFLILRSKIRKKMSPSKEYFAAAGGEILFTEPPIQGWVVQKGFLRRFAIMF
jgi:hypothetical protein